MALTSEQKKSILSEFGLHETDTGSPEAQIALLTNRINNLTSTSSSTSTITTPVVVCCCSLVVVVVC